MFGQYLKQLRIEKGLTQKGLCIHLNLISTEFAAIDSVTISRWERETTTPHPIKAIKILHTLTNDLLPYLNSIDVKEADGLMDHIVYERFHSTKATVHAASYSDLAENTYSRIIEKEIDPSHDSALFDNIETFLKTSKAAYPGLERQNLYQLYRDKKLLVKVYIDATSHEIVGHNLAVFFNYADLDMQLASPDRAISFEKLKPYTENAALAICSLSRFATNEDAFHIVHSDFVRFVAQHANIHFYYHYLNGPILFDYLVSIGAEKVGYDTPDPYGIVKIGSNSFRNCLLKIDSAVILSRPEIINLLKNRT
ncbi:helix-turn-helix transcriptional regulator [Vibrio owensii]|uniref:helix-turn-helix transcriptional regulator n=1 Tax=Vibrio owensii TaxID=696485 RepID=UPI003AACA397